MINRQMILKKKMLDQFIFFIKEKKLLNKDDRILLAVSGGIDSMVMCELFLKSNYKLGIAHANFSLRGKESDDDEKFVKKYAEKNNIPFFTQKFKTKNTATNKKESIQLTARKLRYEWLEKIREENNFDYITTAHHLNDNVETFIMNLSRGTGISGLHGILPKNDKIIRPLLFAAKEEIEQFATANKISYRNDSSNASDKYTRNYVRHHVIPPLTKIYPALIQNVGKTIDHLAQTETLVHNYIKQLQKEIFHEDENELVVKIKDLEQLSPLAIHLFELFKEIGINGDIVNNISVCITEKKYGKVFQLPLHKIYIEKESLVVAPITKKIQRLSTVSKIQKHKSVGESKFVFKTITVTKDFKIDKSPDIGLFDLEKLKFPLQIRNWQNGDSFIPFGMKGKKLVSDFLTDIKMPKNKKVNQLVILSGNDIIWLPGLRIDNRYAITGKSKIIYRIEKQK